MFPRIQVQCPWIHIPVSLFVGWEEAKWMPLLSPFLGCPDIPKRRPGFIKQDMCTRKCHNGKWVAWTFRHWLHSCHCHPLRRNGTLRAPQATHCTQTPSSFSPAKADITLSSIIISYFGLWLNFMGMELCSMQRCAVSCSVYISEIIRHPSTAPSFPLLCYFVFYKNATLHLNLQPGCFQINASKKAIINFILVENVYILLGNICVPSGNAITGWLARGLKPFWIRICAV